MKTCYIPLEGRGILKLSGKNVRSFLQGLITQDITLLSEEQSLYSAFLTPQGKFLHDFFISLIGQEIFLEAEKERLEDLKIRLSMYQLRSNVRIEDLSGLYKVYGLLGEGILEKLGLSSSPGQAYTQDQGKIYVDPRTPLMGARALLPLPLIPQEVSEELFKTYDLLRLSVGLPDGSRDMKIERAIPLECGLDEFNAISWTKGCYLGQELTARTKYRGLVRKKYFPCIFEGTSPEFGTLIFNTAGEEVGETLSTCENKALIRLRLDAFEEVSQNRTILKAGETFIHPQPLKI